MTKKQEQRVEQTLVKQLVKKLTPAQLQELTAKNSLSLYNIDWIMTRDKVIADIVAIAPHLSAAKLCAANVGNSALYDIKHSLEKMAVFVSTYGR